MKHLLFEGAFFLMEESNSVWTKCHCVKLQQSCCALLLGICLWRESFYRDVNHLSCRAALAETQSQGLWLFLRLGMRQRILSLSCWWTLEIMGFLAEVTAPWAQSFFQIQMKFHSTRESHFRDLLTLSMLNIKRIIANNGGVELEIILRDVKFKAVEL